VLHKLTTEESKDQFVNGPNAPLLLGIKFQCTAFAITRV
jgi:hypothetical protein